MQNYNSVVFATAGAGKSYLIKLEVLRSLMMGTDIIVVDPENEYRELCVSSGGQYIAFGYSEDSKINPFDLTLAEEDGQNGLNTKVLSLHKLLKVMLGEMDPIEESIMDRAMMDAYKMKGITPDPSTQNREPPLIEDLYKSLIGMEDEKAKSLAARLEKYIKGSFSGIFNQKTTVNLTNNFVVFGIKNLEDSMRPVAMQIILDYIWTVVKKTLRKRILVVDEAWYLMKHPDSAEFLRGIVKRGRKYYLGVTTITQDVDDFLNTDYGKEIVTNSSIQILLKQHSAAIDLIGNVFYLSQGEKQLLLSASKGEGIFFAGQNHVAIKVIASEDEHNMITSNPEDVLRKQNLLNNQRPPSNDLRPPINPLQTKPEEIKKPDVGKIEFKIPENKIVEEILKPVQQNQSEPIKNEAELKPEERKIEVIPKINIPEIKTVEIKETIRPSDIPLNQTAVEQVIQSQPEIKKEDILFKKPEVVVLSTEQKNENTVRPAEIKVEEVKNEVRKPIFIKTEEQQVPQPPQLARKPLPVFESPSPKVTEEPEKKVEEVKKPEETNKMDYDKLFGNGIV